MGRKSLVFNKLSLDLVLIDSARSKVKERPFNEMDVKKSDKKRPKDPTSDL